MVLRCSLLGHDYGDAQVEREREERGSEVVVTVEEYEECARCGDRHVISENTEVRSNSSRTASTTPASPDEPETDTDPDRPAAADAADTSPATDAAGPSTDGAPSAGAPTGTDPSEASAEEVEIPTDETGEPITDDGEILEDEESPGDEEASSPADRERGEWPDSDDVGPPVGSRTEPAAWPDEGADAAADAASDSATDTGPAADHAGDATEEPLDVDAIDDAVFVDDESIDEAAFADSDPGAAAVDGEATGIERDRPAPAPGEGAALEDVPTEFYCPRCEFVAAGNRGSLRAGDICPDCRRGYLSEREQ